MSANRATGLGPQLVQKWVIDSNVEYQLRSRALLSRLLDESLSNGSIEFSLRCPNLVAIGWGKRNRSACAHPSCESTSLVVPNLESIPELAFSKCRHLVSVVFGEHNDITNLGESTFSDCSPSRVSLSPTSSRSSNLRCSTNAKTGALRFHIYLSIPSTSSLLLPTGHQIRHN